MEQYNILCASPISFPLHLPEVITVLILCNLFPCFYDSLIPYACIPKQQCLFSCFWFLMNGIILIYYCVANLYVLVFWINIMLRFTYVNVCSYSLFICYLRQPPAKELWSTYKENVHRNIYKCKNCN